MQVDDIAIKAQIILGGLTHHGLRYAVFEKCKKEIDMKEKQEFYDFLSDLARQIRMSEDDVTIESVKGVLARVESYVIRMAIREREKSNVE